MEPSARTAFDVRNPYLADWLAQQSVELSGNVTQTTLDNLTETLSEGIKEGEGIPALKSRVEGVYGEARGSRAKMIARTEANKAANGASWVQAESSGVVKTKTWLATKDGRTRPAHAAISGETVPIDEPFSNGKMFPDEVNCRCTLTYGVDESKITPEEERVEPVGIDPHGDDVTYDESGIVIVNREGVPSADDLARLKGAYPDASMVMWGDEVVDLADVVGVGARKLDNFSDAMKLNNAAKFGAAQDDVRDALRAIDDVHGVRGVKPIPLRARKMPDEEGRYKVIQRGGIPEGKEIVVNPNGMTPAFAAVHEMGHHLDLEAIGRKGMFGTANRLDEPAVAEWYDTVKESDAYRQLILERSANPEFRQYYDYLLQPEELWARSYAQHIATKGNSPALRRDLDKWRAEEPELQWSDDDFAAISERIDGVFDEKGWRRG